MGGKRTQAAQGMVPNPLPALAGGMPFKPVRDGAAVGASADLVGAARVNAIAGIVLAAPLVSDLGSAAEAFDEV